MSYETVKVTREDGIAWVELNRPAQRNAMSPQLHEEMGQVLNELETDNDVRVVVLTGAGDAWCAGQDLKLFFRALDNDAPGQARAHWASHQWRWQRLYCFPKPTIAMVNGFCFGGAFTQLIACDFAIAAENATFGLSEINWGIIPGGFVSKALSYVLSLRDTAWYALTGDTFDGREAARIGLVSRAVPADRLLDETLKLARHVCNLNPEAVRATKQAIKRVRSMHDDDAVDYLAAKQAELTLRDGEFGRQTALAQFLDQKSFRPGFGPYSRAPNDAPNPATPQGDSFNSHN